jgi:hypothetical protein
MNPRHPNSSNFFQTFIKLPKFHIIDINRPSFIHHRHLRRPVLQNLQTTLLEVRLSLPTPPLDSSATPPCRLYDDLESQVNG